MKSGWKTGMVLSALGMMVPGAAGADKVAEAGRGPDTGVLEIRVTDRNGAPFVGLGVGVHGHGRIHTDAAGLARFPNLPAGLVSAAFFDVFVILDPQGQPMPQQIVLPHAAVAWVQPGQVSHLDAQVEVQVGPAPGLNCASTPWAIVGVTEGGIVPFLAKGSVGRTGTCACKGFADDPMGDPPCPGTTVFGAGAAPPAQLWTVISETCLGEVPACAEPIEAAEASIFH